MFHCSHSTPPPRPPHPPTSFPSHSPVDPHQAILADKSRDLLRGHAPLPPPSVVQHALESHPEQQRLHRDIITTHSVSALHIPTRSSYLPIYFLHRCSAPRLTLLCRTSPHCAFAYDTCVLSSSRDAAVCLKAKGKQLRMQWRRS